MIAAKNKLISNLADCINTQATKFIEGVVIAGKEDDDVVNQELSDSDLNEFLRSEDHYSNGNDNG